MFDPPDAIAPETIVQRLKSKGLRVTPQRFAVYANLLHRQDHPTAEQILQDLNMDAPRSSQATVYSALQTLQASGLIREVLLDPGVCRYDAKMEPHHHFHCRQCGAIVDLPWNCFPPLDLQALQHLSPSLVPERYEITILGQCDRCH